MTGMADHDGRTGDEQRQVGAVLTHQLFNGGFRIRVFHQMLSVLSELRAFGDQRILLRRARHGCSHMQKALQTGNLIHASGERQRPLHIHFPDQGIVTK